jgi:hypothetical protein
MNSSRRSLKIRQATTRFDILPTLYGFEVIDRDGRTVAETDTRAEAETLCHDLDDAAFVGRSALADTIARL